MWFAHLIRWGQTIHSESLAVWYSSETVWTFVLFMNLTLGCIKYYGREILFGCQLTYKHVGQQAIVDASPVLRESYWENIV
jgi:hypothetical protein